jgi:midasin (ATPase involved in ribosome maturation)
MTEIVKMRDVRFDPGLFVNFSSGTVLDNLLCSYQGLPKGVNYMIIGDPGVGKTTIILDLIANIDRQNAGTRILFISAEMNEIDLADAGEVSALNDVLDGRPLVIAENGGEIVRPHPRFRFIATGNSAGFGDETGRYAGVRPLNMAFMDRFRILDVPYADPKVEQALLQRMVPKLGADVAGCMVQLAGHIRRTFETGDCSVTLSTRGLCRWARLAHDYRRAPFPLRIALDEILLRRASPSDRDSILDQCRVIFGNLRQGAESGDKKSEKSGARAEKSAES